MTKLEIRYPRKFIEGSTVIFKVHETNQVYSFKGKILGYTTQLSNRYYIRMYSLDRTFCKNDILFYLLKIDISVFMRCFFNQDRCGCWPEVDTLEELKLMCKLLEHYHEL